MAWPDLLPSPQGLRDNLWAAFGVLALTAATSWGLARYKKAPASQQLFLFLATEFLIGTAGAAATLRYGLLVGLWSVLALFVPVTLLLVLDGQLNRGSQRPTGKLPIDTTETPTARPPLPAALTEGRIIIAVSPEFLTHQFENRTDFQAQQIVKLYIDKWMRVSGRLGNHMDKMVVLRKSKPWSPSVYMFFEDELAIAQLSTMPPGSELDVLGKVKQVDSISVVLKDCLLIDQV